MAFRPRLPRRPTDLPRVIRNVILDWSGTVVDDLPPTLEATNAVLTHFGGRPLTIDGFREHFQLPYPDFYEQFLPGIPLERLEAIYHQNFVNSPAAVTVLEHAAEFLEFCRVTRRRVFVLSSIQHQYFCDHVDSFGFDALIEKAFTGVIDKTEGIGSILEENRIDPSETVFVGDMVHDVVAAKRGGVRSVAVLTGYDSATKLISAGPDALVSNLSVLRSILGWGDPQGTMPISTVGALIFDEEGQVLLVKTRKWSNKWGIPGGKIERGEGAVDALRREIFEETGLELDKIAFVMVQDCVDPGEFFRESHFLLLNYTAVCHGGDVTLNDEAEAFRWVPLEDALSLDLNAPTQVLVSEVLSRMPGGRQAR